jgi:hypothetical protein
VARLLAGAPAIEVDPAQFSEPWKSLAQTIVQASQGKRLPAFEGALSSLPGHQAAEIRARGGKDVTDFYLADGDLQTWVRFALLENAPT